MSIILDGTSGITSPNETITGSLNTPNTFGFKNRIINGGMVIDQRNAGASVTPTTNVYTLDRWQAINAGVSSKFSVQQSTVAPAGFKNSLLVTSLSAYSISSTDRFAINQNIEGFNVADMGWGTANAQSATMSFWVRSSLTGLFGGALENAAVNRSYAFSYTINSANTWEQKTITFAGDTTGTWATDNSIGLTIYFGLGAGSTFSGTAGSWQAADLRSATGATSVVGTSGATFYITGVQLEKGSVATSFDQRAYSQELAMCQRYFSKSFLQGTAPVQNSGSFSGTAGIISVNPVTRVLMDVCLPVVMRAAPAVTFFNPAAANAEARDANASTNCSSTGTFTIGDRNFTISTVGSASSNQGNGLSVHWTANIEL